MSMTINSSEAPAFSEQQYDPISEQKNLINAIYPPNGWQSLEADFPARGSSSIDALISRYVHQLSQLPHTGVDEEQKESLRQKVMRRAFRDLYMAYAILKDEEKLAQVIHLANVLKEEASTLFGDIDVMLLSGFDPYWKVTTLVFAQHFTDKFGNFLRASQALSSIPDTISFYLKDLTNVGLLFRYRTIHHLILWQSSRLARDDSSLLPIETLGKPISEVRKLFMIYVDNEEDDFDPSIYYTLLLSHHHPLKERINVMFNLFWQAQEGGRVEISSEKLVKLLRTSSLSEREKAVGYLDKVSRHVSSRFFPHIAPSELDRDPCQISVRSKDTLPIPGKEATLDFEKRILEESSMAPLPRIHSNALAELAEFNERERVNFEVITAVHRFKNDAKKLVPKLFQILMEQFRVTKTKKQLLGRTAVLVHHLHLALRNCSGEESPFRNSWSRLFDGSLTQAEARNMLRHLDVECVRKYRMANSFDFCGNIKKFLSSEEYTERFQATPRLEENVSKCSSGEISVKYPSSKSGEQVTAMEFLSGSSSVEGIHHSRVSHSTSSIGQSVKRSNHVKASSSLYANTQHRRSQKRRSLSISEKMISDTLSDSDKASSLALLTGKGLTSSSSSVSPASLSPKNASHTYSSRSFESLSEESPRSGEVVSDAEGSLSDPKITDHNYNDLSIGALSVRITEAVIFHVLTAKDEKSACDVVKNAINFAVQAIDAPVANLHVARSIFLGLEEKSVSRLKFIFKSLDSRTDKNYERLKNLFDSSKNYSSYREFLRKCDRPYIPHLGVITSDLTFATENDFSEEQKMVVLGLLEDFEKTTAMMKFAVPLKPSQSDCVSLLNTRFLEEKLCRPLKRADFKGTREWEDGEWEKLDSEEKTWLYSYQRWPKPSEV